MNNTAQLPKWARLQIADQQKQLAEQAALLQTLKCAVTGIQPDTGISASLHIHLNEMELRALDGLAGYDVDAFLKVFYEKMGKHYLQPHEAGLRSLFARIRSFVPTYIRRIDVARKAFEQP